MSLTAHALASMRISSLPSDSACSMKCTCVMGCSMKKRNRCAVDACLTLVHALHATNAQEAYCYRPRLHERRCASRQCIVNALLSASHGHRIQRLAPWPSHTSAALPDHERSLRALLCTLTIDNTNIARRAEHKRRRTAERNWQVFEQCTVHVTDCTALCKPESIHILMYATICCHGMPTKSPTTPALVDACSGTRFAATSRRVLLR